MLKLPLSVTDMFLSLPLEFDDLSLSLLSQSKPKNKKNKLLYQNRIRKILEDRNCIIYVIVEARGPKCIFFETYGTPLMVAAFSFWSPLFQSQLS